MTPVRAIAALVVALVVAASTAGCGDDDAAAPASVKTAAPVPAPSGRLSAPTTPTATFVFDAGELKPSVLRVPATSSLRVVLIAADGRPHAAVITVGKRPQRLLVQPGGRGELQLHGLRRGHRYRVVPDGATEPVTIQVG